MGKEKSAGLQWLEDFRVRHNELLSLGNAQETSLARATALNKDTVGYSF